jgi:hypothetical protein
MTESIMGKNQIPFLLGFMSCIKSMQGEAGDFLPEQGSATVRWGALR